MERSDSYQGFARHYDLHGWDWFAPTHGPRLVELLRGRGLDSGRILDAGCGSGTLALLLAGEGYRVTGVDLSEGLLETARRKDRAGTVTWTRADVTRLDLLADGAPPFDAVTCVADTLNHLESLDEWEAAFGRFAAHLRPGGLLFLDVVTVRGLRRHDAQSASEQAGRTLILSGIYEPRSRRSTLKVVSFVPTGRNGLYERAAETVTEWGQPVRDILERLGRAGFVDPERPWTDTEDPENDERLMVLARRA